MLHASRENRMATQPPKKNLKKYDTMSWDNKAGTIFIGRNSLFVCKIAYNSYKYKTGDTAHEYMNAHEWKIKDHAKIRYASSMKMAQNQTHTSQNFEMKKKKNGTGPHTTVYLDKCVINR